MEIINTAPKTAFTQKVVFGKLTFIQVKKLYLGRENSAPISASAQMRERLAVILKKIRINQ